MTPAAPTTAELAAGFLSGDRWRDPLQQLIACDRLDESGRPLDAAMRRVLVQPGEDRHRLAVAEVLEREAGRGPCPQCDGDGYTMAEVQIHVERETCSHCRGLGRAPDGRTVRAEFIRTQIELARYDALTFADCPACEVPGEGYRHADDCPNSPRHPLRRRERLLLTWHGVHREQYGVPYAAWIAISDLRWCRGFIGEITLSCADLLAHAGAVFGAAPVERVTLAGKRPMHDPFAEPGYETMYGVRHPWRWHSTEAGRNEYDHSLPGVIWGNLSGSGRWKNTYPTADAARADLSAAAVALGRNLAHLPPLPAGAAGR